MQSQELTKTEKVAGQHQPPAQPQHAATPKKKEITTRTSLVKARTVLIYDAALH